MNNSSGNTIYTEVAAFNVDDRLRRMEPVKKSRQYLVGVIANLSSVAVGTCLGWTSPVGPKLENKDQTPLPDMLPSDSSESAWISSIIAIGALIAPFGAGILTDKIGRKWTLLSSIIFFIAAYIMLMVNGSPEILIGARFVQGLGVGVVMTAQPMYVGEISTDDCRGALGSFMQLFIVSGILYVYAIGPYVSYMALQWACIVVPVIFAGAFFFMPESPYYYIQKGKKREAINALKFLRGQSDEGVATEMAEIQTSVEESMKTKGSVIDLFKNVGNRKALIISAGLIAFQQLSGINVVLFNAQTIFQDANTGLEPAVATILIGVVQVVSSGITPLIADRLGRKPILLVSGIVMSIGLVTLGAFFYIKSTGDDVSTIGWLPVTALIVYNIVYCTGFGPLPWAVLGEMFPGNVKGIASSLVASTCWILGFLVTFTYPSLKVLGPHVAFFLYGGFCVAAFLFVLFIVMETKGLSLQQIQDKLNGK
ncbi:facilitated trehalose transporter Tret1 [Condylostylus longicornis]|uniref:facilitated trehalose transporter Tret1 n=1 Tax=Condylostylus longicornis TaxID=2530218 RepID=UPI00244E5907|nr:facilitated trehalose transporter Tret1 [Condylostylus longicornis]XP_055378065.1 facilitated trehalose transporter Tret1 [Condylostylus longicornis]XP_055378066.1 facilitated trehalose transporter Tret1 [Condylostylus longicornis]